MSNNADDGKKDEKEEAIEGIDKPIDRHQHAIEMLEDENGGGKLIKLSDIHDDETIPRRHDIVKWVKSIAKYGNANRTMLIFRYDNDNGFKGYNTRFRVKFFTTDHSYSISFRPPLHDDTGYIGCVSSCRKPRVGETWTRGSDLPDGKFKKETFDKIVLSIVSYEMKNLQVFD